MYEKLNSDYVYLQPVKDIFLNNFSLDRQSKLSEILHKEMINRINLFIENPISPFLVTPKIMPDRAYYDRGSDELYLRQGIFNIQESDDYYFKDGIIYESTPEDYFLKVIAHEYGHIVFERDYFEPILKIYDETTLSNAVRVTNSISEAFAFWFSDEICGLDSLTENLAQEYQSSINVNVLNFFYSMFKHESEEMSSSYIMKNLPKMVRNEKDSIISVVLPNYLEHNFHY